MDRCKSISTQVNKYERAHLEESGWESSSIKSSRSFLNNDINTNITTSNSTNTKINIVITTSKNTQIKINITDTTTSNNTW